MDDHPKSTATAISPTLFGQMDTWLRWWLGFTIFDYRQSYPVIGDHLAVCEVCEAPDAAVRFEWVLGLRVVEHSVDTAVRRADFTLWQESQQRVRIARAAYDALASDSHCPPLPATS